MSRRNTFVVVLILAIFIYGEAFLRPSAMTSKMIFSRRALVQDTTEAWKLERKQRLVRERLRFDAYKQIRQLKDEGKEIPENVLALTGRSSVDEVDNDLMLIARLIEDEKESLKEKQEKKKEKMQKKVLLKPARRFEFETRYQRQIEAAASKSLPPDKLYEAKERKYLNRLHHGVKKEVNKELLHQAMILHQRHSTDCGSPEVQVARLNEKIKYLTTHMLRNKKDFSAKRKLQMIVHERRSHMNYLYKVNPSRAIELAKELGIRFRPPGSTDKAVKYAIFKNTKSKVAKLLQAKREARKAAGLGPRPVKHRGLNHPDFPRYTKLY